VGVHLEAGALGRVAVAADDQRVVGVEARLEAPSDAAVAEGHAAPAVAAPKEQEVREAVADQFGAALGR